MLDLLLNLIFPKNCLGCNQAHTYLCTSCQQSIQYFPSPLCPGCGKLIPNLGLHPNCKDLTSLDGLIAVGTHRGVLQKLIKQIKYRGHFDMIATAALLMANRFPHKLNPTVITSVPLHPKRQRERGFNQSELLGKALAKQLHLPYQTLLRRLKYTKPQAGLNRAERLTNMQDVFLTLKSPLKGQILLVDDVATTGVTLNACAQALKKAGANKVYGLVLSHKR